MIFPESTKYNVKQCSKDENKHSLKYEENNMAKEFPSDCTSKRKNSGFVEDFCVYFLCYWQCLYSVLLTVFIFCTIDSVYFRGLPTISK